MRAVWYDRQGAADEVLVCGELPNPEAGHGEVRVRLEASGVNPSDTYRRRGPPAMEYPRAVINIGGAGVVDQVGPGVSRSWLDKRLWLYNGQRNGRTQRRETLRAIVLEQLRAAGCVSRNIYREKVRGARPDRRELNRCGKLTA
jgi:NADPH:quinone reductase-like Zn-dependent oxidoreductase